ncbi:hypothetical protein CSUI_005419 [Cystoisospora suis]|uniref:SHSP domain-containing protein n=1 Tax=Cystoisospora suis TaxID=483139 RepID=A0A2C6KY25_9APIC|nr:hypothetical protein CSUI_005419 [Cystoisospora suis]
MTTSRAVGFLVVLALSTTVISAVPDGAITAKTTTEAKTEETKSTVASLAPDMQKDHSKTSVVSTESKTEKAGTQHSPSATPPRQEMVSFTVNLPLNAIEGDIEESFFNDMFNSFGSFFANLFAVDDLVGAEEDSLNRDVSTAMGPNPFVNKTTTGESADSTGDKEHRAMDVEELLDELDDSDFLSYLTSAYLQPLQGLMNSMMMGLDAYSPSLSVSSQQQKSSSGSSGNGGGIFDLISQLMNSTPESLMGPEVTTNITSESCIFEVDLATVPETASIIVGVEGDAVFVEYSNTIGEKTGKDVDGEQTNVTSADTTTTSQEETTTEVTDETIKPNENYGTTTKSSGNNLRGTPSTLAPTNVYSYERFIINPVCDYESVDAKAARVEDDKLLIKFPIKKDRAEEAATTKDTQTPTADKQHNAGRTIGNSLPPSDEKTHVPSVSASLGVKETEKKSEATTTEKSTVSSSQKEHVSEDISAQIRMAQKTPQTSHRRILPMVAAAEF